MPANPRSAEDHLTNLLAQVLTVPECRRAFWKLVAPTRLHGRLPPEPKAFGRLGTSKPDLLFEDPHPLLYVEAKLGAQTEPMQLTRARSWMRHSGCADDQIVLLADCEDQIPVDIGWPGAAVPVRTVSWHAVHAALCAVAKRESVTMTLVDAFGRALASSMRSSRNKVKVGMRSSFHHPFGEVMHEFAARRGIKRAEFVYGGRIDPRLTYGFPNWLEMFGTSSERLWLFYGPECGFSENYRAQLILWHRSDFAGSREPIAARWDAWRRAILNEPLAEFDFGGRAHSSRTTGGVPQVMPVSDVGLINHPARIPEAIIRQASRADLMKQLDALVAPFERIVDRVLRGS